MPRSGSEIHSRHPRRASGFFALFFLVFFATDIPDIVVEKPCKTHHRENRRRTNSLSELVRRDYPSAHRIAPKKLCLHILQRHNIFGAIQMEPGRIELPSRSSQHSTSTKVVRCSISMLLRYIRQTTTHLGKQSFSFRRGLPTLWNQPEFCTPRCIRRRERCVAGYAASA